MALPALGLGIMAGLGGLKGLVGNRGAAKERENQYAAAEDQRKRAQQSFTLSALPELHGAEQRKTFGNAMGLGFLSNFAKDPKTGVARNEQLGAMFADPWKYRDTAKLAALSPHLAPLPKPKGGGALGFIGDVVGGAAGGAANYYSMGGEYGLDKLGLPSMGGGGGGYNPLAGGGGGGRPSGSFGGGALGGFGPPSAFRVGMFDPNRITAPTLV
jgi:hypothetical protein